MRMRLMLVLFVAAFKVFFAAVNAPPPPPVTVADGMMDSIVEKIREWMHNRPAIRTKRVRGHTYA